MKAADAGRALWLWVGLAFGLLAAAWGVFFFIASRHRVEEVPLQTSKTPLP